FIRAGRAVDLVRVHRVLHESDLLDAVVLLFEDEETARREDEDSREQQSRVTKLHVWDLPFEGGPTYHASGQFSRSSTSTCWAAARARPESRTRRRESRPWWRTPAPPPPARRAAAGRAAPSCAARSRRHAACRTP